MSGKINDESIERALDWLRDNATPAAQARANRIHLEEYRKVIKAQIMAEHLDKPISAQEREAYSDARYVAHLEAMRIAIEEDERMRYLLTAAEARVEAWRTLNANARVQAKVA